MTLLIFLISFPLLAAAAQLLVKADAARKNIIKLSSLFLLFASIALLVTSYHHDVQLFKVDFPPIDSAMLCIEAVLAVYIFCSGIRHGKWLAPILISIQSVILVYFQTVFGGRVTVTNSLFVDKLSIVMALIVSVTGPATCLYAVGYMRRFHEKFHIEVKDNRRLFFSVIFVFLSAMFGIIFSNNLLWLYFFWELTTVASFVLIGYKRTDEARRNSFRALEFNLLGGLAFLIGIVYLYMTSNVMELDKILVLGKTSALVPAMLLCLAGLVKAGQLPFSSWLVGAMVAPVPVSALLHASTMVKAGVYICMRLAPVLEGTLSGLLLALVGGMTFLITSVIAISQREAKKVLAYSTVANLGLVIMCAGMGTYEAMWAAVILVIFHAVSKCLLFLCVGVVEEKTGSMDIEDMAGLVVRMPKVAIIMEIGIAGMFLAPFGMLISKWAVLKAIVDCNPLLVIFLVLGSSATVFYWVKWMGKLIMVAAPYKEDESKITNSEWIPLYALSFLTIAICLLFPLISSRLVSPYLIELYDRTVTIERDNIAIMLMMFGMVMLFPLTFLEYGKRVKVVDAYLGGANTPTSSTQFRAARGDAKDMEMKNYYFEKFLGEEEMRNLGAALALVLIAAAFSVLRVFT